MLAHPSAGQHGLAAEVNERVAEDQGATLPVSGLPHLFRLKAPGHWQKKDPLTGLTTVDRFAEQG